MLTHYRHHQCFLRQHRRIDCFQEFKQLQNQQNYGVFRFTLKIALASSYKPLNRVRSLPPGCYSLIAEYRARVCVRLCMRMHARAYVCISLYAYLHTYIHMYISIHVSY